MPIKKIVPVKGWVLVEVLKPEKSSGALILHTKGPQMPVGTIIETGVDGFKKKDRIIYRPYMPVEVKIENKVYLLVQNEDIIAICH